MTSNKLTILISSPESYRDVFNISAELFLKNWPDCPYRKMYATDFCPNNILLLSGSRNIYKDFEIFCFPESEELVSRTKNALKNITTKYVMLICDDIFLVKKIKNVDFIGLIDIMDANKIVYCRLMKSRIMVSYKNRISKYIYCLSYNQPYGRNLQVAIWDTNFLKELLSNAPNDAYAIEENWLKDALEKGNNIIPGHCYFHNKYFYHSIYKGRWVRDAERVVKKQKVQFVTKRPKLSIKTSFLNKIKKIMRSLLSTKSRVNLKKKLSNYFDIDTKF